MKHVALLIFCFLTGLAAVAAQKAAPLPKNDEQARTATTDLVAKYKLDADQAKEMYTIQVRKLRNQAEIAPLKSSNKAMYRSKVKNLQSGTLNSIRRILHNKEQMGIYDKTQREVRIARAQKQKELTSQGASKEAIEDGMLEIFAE
jgi:hypothetical protein